jgi:hypothetical protein
MLEDGTPLEFVRSQYRGDAYDFIVELSLASGRHQDGVHGVHGSHGAR